MASIPIVSVACIHELTKLLQQSPRGPHGSLSASADEIDEWEMRNAVSVRACAASVSAALRTAGFMYIKDHGIPELIEKTLDTSAREFFRLPTDEKKKISMHYGGRAWRGFFPVGGELTSGKPDLKEGLYFGQERPQDDPRVRSGTPLFGSNLFPERPADLRNAVLEYMTYCEAVGQGLLALVAVALGLPASYFLRSFCNDPTCLFRIFHYPPPETLMDPKLQDRSLWGVGEHTDYGLLTLLKQDDVGGLEVKRYDGQWISAPPIDGTLVVNIGDMMEAMSGGLFMSTPHRVRNRGGPDAMRLSFPFFFDPSFHAVVHPLPLSNAMEREAAETVRNRAMIGQERWDKAGVTVGLKSGATYGDYLLRKVGKVFPDLAANTNTAANSRL